MQQRRLFFAILLPALLGACAQTSPSKTPGVAQLVSGNTMEIGNRFGVAYVYFDPSGSTIMRAGHGEPSEGTWRATDDALCSTTQPSREGWTYPEHCITMTGRRMGDRWTAQDPRNGTIRFRLLRGNKWAMLP